jgi:hypothetical protein
MHHLIHSFSHDHASPWLACLAAVGVRVTISGTLYPRHCDKWSRHNVDHCIAACDLWLICSFTERILRLPCDIFVEIG